MTALVPDAEPSLEPLVSLCIPVFNGARHLDAALNSARCQTFTRLEILVVDDHSTDESVAIAERHESVDARVRVVRNEVNQGLVGNWLRCVALARGSHVKYLFQDDLLDPQCVQRLWDGMQESGASMGFVARRLLMDELTPRVARTFAPIEHRNVAQMIERSRFVSAEEVADLALEHWTVNVLGEPTSVMLRKDVFVRFGGFDERFKQLCDWEYWLRVGVQDGLWFDRSPLATFRLHPAATSLQNQKDRELWTVYGEAALFSCKVLREDWFAPLRARAAEVSPPVDVTRRAVRSLLRLRLRAKRAGSAISLAAVAELAADFAMDVEVPRRVTVMEWIWIRLPHAARRAVNLVRYRKRSRGSLTSR